jgi:hypothetical protein
MSRTTQLREVVGGLVVLCSPSVSGCKCRSCGDLVIFPQSEIFAIFSYTFESIARSCFYVGVIAAAWVKTLEQKTELRI